MEFILHEMGETPQVDNPHELNEDFRDYLETLVTKRVVLEDQDQTHFDTLVCCEPTDPTVDDVVEWVKGGFEAEGIVSPMPEIVAIKDNVVDFADGSWAIVLEVA